MADLETFAKDVKHFDFKHKKVLCVNIGTFLSKKNFKEAHVTAFLLYNVLHQLIHWLWVALPVSESGAERGREISWIPAYARVRNLKSFIRILNACFVSSNMMAVFHILLHFYT